jgi:hypothetical protein
LFSHLMARWRDLFNANFDVLLYDLTVDGGVNPQQSGEI